MDTRRTIIAIAFSFLILLGWNQLSVQMGWISEPTPPAPQQQQQQAAPVQSAAQATPAAPLPTIEPAPGRDVVVLGLGQTGISLAR